MADQPQELISVRECARRLGVSDTAVHKARKAGRITVASTTPEGWPLVAWPQARDDWGANSDATKRTHVGATGTSPARAKYATTPAEVKLPTRAQTLAGDIDPADAESPSPGRPAAAVQGPSLAQSKAIREAYLARLAKLEYEEKTGKLVNAEDVKARAFKMAREARDAMLTLPDRLAPILASLTDVQEIHRVMREDIERTCADIAKKATLATAK